jgi:isopenicillin-N epimerase
VLRSFADGLSERTKIAIIDHVTSPTALLLPVAKLASLGRNAGALVLIDGAHAPGMVLLDLTELDCDFYTGNCHKWLCAPKGCGFLWTADAHRNTLHPTVISHGYDKGFLAEFDWTGTRDASAQFVLPDALAFLDRFGHAAIREHNHALVVTAADMLATSWNTRVGATEPFIGSMAMVELPLPGPGTTHRALELRAQLLGRYRIQVPVNALRNRFWVRLSAHIYNVMEDYERLDQAVRGLTV